MKSLIIRLAIFFTIIIPTLMFVSSAHAQEALLSDTQEAQFSKCTPGSPGCPNGGGCIETGNCQLSDFTVLLVRISQIILGLTGSLALLAFVYGGVLFLSSGGNKELVEKGKSTLVGAAIGIFIVFASYTIIGFTISAFNPEAEGIWSSSGWFSSQQTK